MFRQIEYITLNVASIGWIIASLLDYLPILVGALVGLSIAGLNAVRIITEIKKWKANKENKTDAKDG